MKESKDTLRERKRCMAIARHWFDDFVDVETYRGRLPDPHGSELARRMADPTPFTPLGSNPKRKTKRKSV